MRAPRFWANPKSLWAYALQPAACLWTLATRARRNLTPAQRSVIPSICVGNLVAGGAGKTPTAMAVMQLLRTAGHNPAFVTRGYGGKLNGPVRVTNHAVTDVGDEALLLAACAPTWVSRDRAAGVAAAAQAGHSHAILDDGLQNPALAYDRALLVIDGTYGLGNGRVIPAGPLREPLADALQRVDAVVMIGAAATPLDLAAACQFTARVAAVPPTAQAARYVAFAGIARPEKFFATCRDLGLPVVATRSFPDHHLFSAADVTALQNWAKAYDAKLLTTTKDAVRLSLAVDTVRINICFDDPSGILRLLERS